MRESRQSGSVRGALSNERPYRDSVAVCDEGAFREKVLPFGVQHLSRRRIQSPHSHGQLRALSSIIQGGSRMRETRTYGSARGALSNERAYRDPNFSDLIDEFTRLTRKRFDA